MTNNDATRPLRILAQTIQTIRAFFDEQGFQEVISPVLHSALPLEPTIYPFTTTWHTNQGNQQLYLATSPESYLKKLLAKGLGNCYSIGHSFRNLESSGSRHHPEFLMLEWYREDANYHNIMVDLELLIERIVEVFSKSQVMTSNLKTYSKHLSPSAKKSKIGPDISKVANQPISGWKCISSQGRAVNFQPPFPRVSLDQQFKEKIGINIADILTDEAIQKCATRRGYNIENATWEQLFNQIFLNEIEPYFSKQPFFLTDFPAKLSPLCKRNSEKPYLAERFEFFIAGLELANGNTEKTDVNAVARSFQAEHTYRVATKKPNSAIDKEFIASLEKLNSRSYAGVGVGVERLAMILAGIDDIHQLSPVASIRLQI